MNFNTRDRTLELGKVLNEKIYKIEKPTQMIVNDKLEIKPEEVNVGETVTLEQKQELVDVLNAHRDCIAQNIFELGKTESLETNIQEKPGSVPINEKPYRTTIAERDEISKIIQEKPGSVPINEKPYRTTIAERDEISKIIAEWKKAGTVTETKSPYASPVLLVKKKNGESRFVIDYRKLNSPNLPLPNLDEHLETLCGTNLFVTLDLAHGYLQLPLDKESRQKTAFIKPEETGEFTRAMFGLMNAPFYFSKLMQCVLGPLRNDIVLFYSDDMLIPASNWDQLTMRLKQVLQRLRDAKLTIKLSKCEFGKTKIEYLGFKISGERIEPADFKD
ncbi:Reverse transcriptase (RNA-dependent DNA polymerase) [Popillia japonica]|uniref:Reverse transcriptase (RNA-dependent DNA polymerase) n=1 Tax=Popillia japonica TaxID=7064 RepID=A0AAW1NM96_POPJA